MHEVFIYKYVYIIWSCVCLCVWHSWCLELCLLIYSLIIEFPGHSSCHSSFAWWQILMSIFALECYNTQEQAFFWIPSGFQLQNDNILSSTVRQYQYDVFIHASYLPESWPGITSTHPLLLGNFSEVIWSSGWHHPFCPLPQHLDWITERRAVVDFLENIQNLATNSSFFPLDIPLPTSSQLPFLCLNYEHIQTLSLWKPIDLERR